MDNTLDKRLILLEDKDLCWSFNSYQSGPSYSLQGRLSYGSSENVDPFPCYHHDMDLVKSAIEFVEKTYPIACLPMWYILSHESLCRTNGSCSNHYFYDKDEEKLANSPFEPVILLSGKRIPLMQSMTKYLISHEYSHAVEAWIRYKKDYKDDERDRFLKDYMWKRGEIANKEYGGRKWHKNSAEIFANDARIILFNLESDFWPHDCKHPLEHKEILEYWNTNLINLKYNANEIK